MKERGQLDQHNIIWFKGEIMPQSEALINVMAPTSQFGLNVFEGIRGYWSEADSCLFIFRLSDHIDRLFQSCKLLNFDCKYSKKEIEGYVRDIVVAGNFTSDIALRCTLFVDGAGSWSSLDSPDLFISPIAKPRKDVQNLSGASAAISSWRRIDDNSMPPRVKTGANYVAGRYAHLEANRAGYDLPIFLNSSGKVAEGAGACLFMVKNDTLVTPTLQSSVLESITRDTLLKITRELDLKVEVREIDRTELLLADEVFLCGSAAEVTPLTNINGVTIGSGLPGKVTVRVLRAYHKLVSNNWKIPLSTSWLSRVPLR